MPIICQVHHSIQIWSAYFVKCQSEYQSPRIYFLFYRMTSGLFAEFPVYNCFYPAMPVSAFSFIFETAFSFQLKYSLCLIFSFNVFSLFCPFFFLFDTNSPGAIMAAIKYFIPLFKILSNNLEYDIITVCLVTLVCTY